MRKIKEHYKLILVIIIGLMFLIVMSKSYIERFNGNVVTNSLVRVANVIQRPFVITGQGIEGFFNDISNMRGAVKENKKLDKEVADLKNKLTKATLEKEEYAALNELKTALNYIPRSEGSKVITSSVTSNDGTNWYYLFTVGVGKTDGVRVEDVVVNHEGLVGLVYETGSHWSKVSSMLDKNTSVSFKVLRDTQILGMVSGNGKEGMTGYTFEEKSDIQVGDTLITSGLGVAPEGIVIGTVTKVKKDKSRLRQTITVKPSVDFKRINKISIIHEEK